MKKRSVRILREGGTRKITGDLLFLNIYLFLVFVLIEKILYFLRTVLDASH